MADLNLFHYLMDLMASIIPGYNYAIAISYRQKDNKGDKWMSEFVNKVIRSEEYYNIFRY
jgi:hypothetical protein